MIVQRSDTTEFFDSNEVATAALRQSRPVDDDEILAIMNSLFATGLDLIAVHATLDGDAAAKILDAVGRLDDVIQQLRGVRSTSPT